MTEDNIKKMADAMSAISCLRTPVFRVREYVEGKPGLLLDWIRKNKRLDTEVCIEEFVESIYHLYK